MEQRVAGSARRSRLKTGRLTATGSGRALRIPWSESIKPWHQQLRCNQLARASGRPTNETPETHFTLRRALRTSQLDIELPSARENQEHGEIHRYRTRSRFAHAVDVVSCRSYVDRLPPKAEFFCPASKYKHPRLRRTYPSSHRGSLKGISLQAHAEGEIVGLWEPQFALNSSKSGGRAA